MSLIDEICRDLPRLDEWQLQTVHELIAEFLYETDEREAELEPEPAAGDESEAKEGARGWVELKMIRGYGPYAYRRWREGKTLRSEYIGKVREGETS